MAGRYLLPLLCLASLSGQTGLNVSKAIDTYCSGCHNGRMRSPSGVLLDQFDAARISASPDGELRLGDFDGDVAAQARVVCAVDLAHAALTQKIADLVVAQNCARRERHRRPGYQNDRDLKGP